jgi:hypothetical protein
MSLHPPIEREKALAVEMGTYYAKGMGAILQGMLSAVDTCQLSSEPTVREAAKSHCESRMNHIEELYSTVPREVLRRDMFQPLAPAKSMLPMMRMRLGRALDTQSESDVQSLQLIMMEFTHQGDLYRRNFERLTSGIRETSGNEDFWVLCYDEYGREWSF